MNVSKMPVLAVAAAALAVAAAGCTEKASRDPSPSRPPAGNDAPSATLTAFASQEELAAYLRKLAEQRRREMQRLYSPSLDAAPEAEPSVAASADGAAKEEAESVTNVQHAGVDEGGIVKVHGDHLVMLRRGRLFTVKIGDGDLRPVSAVDAYGPGIDPGGAWYDEMLISGDVVIVIGYSYSGGGTEVGLFSIDRSGALKHTSTYHLRSNDYYSSRNYASRLVDGKLVFYTPLYLPLHGDDPLAGFPALRRWHPGAGEGEFRPIVSATRVYRPAREMGADDGVALHTVTVCDLAGGEMSCEGTAVLGPAGRVFYVSPGSVYVWVTDWISRGDTARTESMVYRMPLDGSGPSALAARGSPVDQFSFLESEDGHLNVLVRADASGDGMWSAEAAAGDVALLRVPVSSFGDGAADAPASAYRALPTPRGYTFQNRFVGDYLLYGTGSGWGGPEPADSRAVYAVRWAGGGAARLALPHGVDRIEAMGPDAVVVGTDGTALHFSAVRLGREPELAGRYALAGASQGELRSHGFFYKAESARAGVLGLPVRGGGRPGYEHLFEGSASILYLRNEGLSFGELGQLASRAEGTADDGCRASCVDWYGNARPLFLRGRVFALLGYEIVEGAIDDGRIRETRRVSYAPRQVVAGR